MKQDMQQRVRFGGAWLCTAIDLDGNAAAADWTEVNAGPRIQHLQRFVEAAPAQHPGVAVIQDVQLYSAPADKSGATPGYQVPKHLLQDAEKPNFDILPSHDVAYVPNLSEQCRSANSRSTWPWQQYT